MVIEFKECRKCHGYGVLDSGNCCKQCGGKGKRNPFDRSGILGCGDEFFDTETQSYISYKNYCSRIIIEKNDSSKEQ